LAGEEGFGELGFEAGDAGVEEAVVLAGGLDPLGELLIAGGELAVLQAERPVLRIDSLDGVGGEVDFEVPDAAQELADLVSLAADLGVRGLEGVLGVKRAVLPGAALSGVMAAAGGCGSWTVGVGEEFPGLLVPVEEGAGDLCPACDHGRLGRDVVAAHLAERVADALEHLLGVVPPGLDGGLGPGRVAAHPALSSGSVREIGAPLPESSSPGLAEPGPATQTALRRSSRSEWETFA
jgi:hypothetical protein